MIACSYVSIYVKNAVQLKVHVRQMGSSIVNSVSGRQSTSCCFCLYPGYSSANYRRLSVSQTFYSPSVSSSLKSNCFGSQPPNQRGNFQSLTIKGLVSCRGALKRQLKLSLPSQNVNMKLSLAKQGMLSKIKSKAGPISWSQECASVGLIFGLFYCYSSSQSAHAEASMVKKGKEDDCDYVKYSHGKKVYTNYSIIGIPGDGRCLFRSVAHGARLRSGKPAPREILERDLADDLRARVADEFIKRRQESEWFVEGDFDTYVAQMRKPHVWGGEPELFMASHVLKMPITVYMYDKNAGGLISIAEYGEEYGKDNPIRVLYHGFGHYDALQIPGRKDGKPKL